MPEPLIAAVIANWNQKDLTLAAVESLFQDGWSNLLVIVIDNGSKDGSVTAISERFPAVRQIVNPGNFGFAKANNQGFELALSSGAEFIFLLNNDAAVASGTLGELHRYLDKHPRCGAVAPYIFYAGTGDLIWFGGGVADLTWGRIGHLAIRQRFNPILHGEVLCGYLTGCAYLVRSRLIVELGGFDPVFGLYSEDVDLSIRHRNAGWELWAIPSARVDHKVSVSAGGPGSPLKAFHLARSTTILMKRYLSPRSWLLLIPAGAVGAFANSLRLIVIGKASSVPAFFQGLWSGLTGRRPPRRFRLEYDGEA
ncbi:MAG: glycosyltransferase family 2 protein [Calditrichaeota bacterium]|nr:glycosyltransferase family 2 protein [Calditrichota bacterium]